MILAKDVRRTYAANVDFFFTNEELSIVLNDEEGVLRVLTYDPSGTALPWIGFDDVDGSILDLRCLI